MKFDLDDLKTWEPVLFGAPSKKQLIREVQKRKETKLMGKRHKLVEVPDTCVFHCVVIMRFLSCRLEDRYSVLRHKQPL